MSGQLGTKVGLVVGAASPIQTVTLGPAGTTPCRPPIGGARIPQSLMSGPSPGRPGSEPMDAMYPRVAGLDIHKKLIVACRIIPGAGAQAQREVRSFGATTAAIEDLGDWLAEGEVTHVAMEATSVYWKPIFNLLEDRFALVLANAQHIKGVPGR